MCSHCLADSKTEPHQKGRAQHDMWVPKENVTRSSEIQGPSPCTACPAPSPTRAVDLPLESLDPHRFRNCTTTEGNTLSLLWYFYFFLHRSRGGTVFFLSGQLAGGVASLSPSVCRVSLSEVSAHQAGRTYCGGERLESDTRVH